MNIDKFKRWLSDQGCEILPLTNDFEALRFKGCQTGVLYKSGKTSSPYVDHAMKCFTMGKKWNGQPIKTAHSCQSARLHQSHKATKEELIKHFTKTE